MPRQSLYVVSEVLDDAIEIVLQHGFHASSMDEIIARTNFNRRAFYLEFGNKDGFLNALVSHYVAQHLRPLQQTIDNGTHPRVILEFFAQYTRLIQDQGCLLVNLVAELGADNEEVVEQARGYYEALQLSFVGLIERLSQLPDSQPTLPAEATSLILLNLLHSIAIQSSYLQSDEVVATYTEVIQGLFLSIQSEDRANKDA